MIESNEDERRVRRSDRADRASQYCLQTATVRHGVGTMVLADERGRFIAGSQQSVHAGQWGSSAVDLERGRRIAEQAPKLHGNHHFLNVWTARLRLGDRGFFLVSVGQRAEAQAAAADAAEGLARILLEEQRLTDPYGYPPLPEGLRS